MPPLFFFAQIIYVIGVEVNGVTCDESILSADWADVVG